MPIENRNLTSGTKLVAKYHKQTYTCEVIAGEGESGKVRYRLEDGREFKSPSAAGMAITGKACNGWAFWSVETTQVAPDVQKTDAAKEASVESVESKDAAGEPAPAKKRIFRLPNQKGVPEGQTRWYCHECSKSFLTPAETTPVSCPQGHKAN